MTYKTIVIDYTPKAKKMAAVIEQTANEQAQDGWELVSFSVTNSAKAILLFRVPQGNAPAEKRAADKAPAAKERPVENASQEETVEAVGDAV